MPISRLFSDSQKVQDLEIPENIRVPANLLDLRALLERQVDARDVDFYFDGEQGSFDNMFAIDRKSGFLLLTESPDRERRPSYQLRLKAVLRDANAEDDGIRESASKVPVLFYTLYLSSGNES